VFSHDELICKMASLPAGCLDLTLSLMVFSDMLTMIEEEKKLRKQLLYEVC
jgi:histone demethylase JARID1